MRRGLFSVVVVLLSIAAVVFAQRAPSGVDIKGKDYTGFPEALRLAYAMGIATRMSAAATMG